MKAVMLFRSGGRVSKATDIAEKLRALEFVTEAYAVFGRFDIVAFLEGGDVKDIFKSVSEATQLEGIMSSESFIEVVVDQESPEYGKWPFPS
jgi:DNA-binding Lrp family transcriptional regulator